MKLKGFNLIEILVVLVLFGFIGTLIATSLSTSLKAKKRVEEISGRYFIASQALNRMTRE